MAHEARVIGSLFLINQSILKKNITMNKKLLELELDTFIDWLIQNVEEPYEFDITKINNVTNGESLLSKYMLDRPNFMTEMKKLYPSLYADVVL